MKPFLAGPTPEPNLGLDSAQTSRIEHLTCCSHDTPSAGEHHCRSECCAGVSGRIANKKVPFQEGGVNREESALVSDRKLERFFLRSSMSSGRRRPNTIAKKKCGLHGQRMIEMSLENVTHAALSQKGTRFTDEFDENKKLAVRQGFEPWIEL